MDVFEAANSRRACRHFLDKQVDPDIVRRLLASADGNDFPWVFNPPDTY
jgi:nitroreductase